MNHRIEMQVPHGHSFYRDLDWENSVGKRALVLCHDTMVDLFPRNTRSMFGIVLTVGDCKTSRCATPVRVSSTGDGYYVVRIRRQTHDILPRTVEELQKLFPRMARALDTEAGAQLWVGVRQRRKL